jgi:hypothetical protein
VQNVGGTAANGATIGTFDVNIDELGPVAVLTPADVYKPNTASTKTIEINYFDASGVKTSSLGTGDIEVAWPDGTLATPTLTQVTGSGTSVKATYTMSVPGGFTAADLARQGTYFVTVRDQEVSDNLGNLNGALSAGSFRVFIDNQPPSASGGASDVTDSAQDAEISVFYGDDPGIDQTTLDDLDIRITGPNGFNQPVTLLNVDAPDGSSANATYRLPAPAGGWALTQNGTYHIILQSNQVADLSGNFALTADVGTFDINLNTAVMAHFSTDQTYVNGPNLPQVTIRFNQKVTGFDKSDLALFRNGDPIALTAAQTLSSTDGINYTLAGLTPLTSQSDFYQLTIVAANSGIKGQLNQAITDDQYTFFQIDATPPGVSIVADAITQAGSRARHVPSLSLRRYGDRYGRSRRD